VQNEQQENEKYVKEYAKSEAGVYYVQKEEQIHDFEL
jgi:hypothetical protein